MFRPKVEIDPFKAKKRKTIIVLLTVVAIIAASLLYYVNQKEEPLPPSFAVCDLSQEEIINRFEEYEYEDKLVIKDHYFYGETLSLFEEKYKINEKNSLLGKTLVLFNLCTEEEYFYLIDADVDGQLPLDQLPQGLYEVFVNVDMIKKRVITEAKFEDNLNLVRRNKESMQIQLIADQNIFDDKDHNDYLDDNYLFLNVTNIENSNKDYDVVIDPFYGTNPSGWHDNFGPTINDKRAADELYDMATIMKNELEKSGLKVLITRKNKDEIVNVYGLDGRLDRAYDSKAKYYVELAFGSDSQGGLKVYRSSFVSIRLAGSVANHLLLETNLESPNSSGVYKPLRYNGLDGILTIRELGGKSLSAATFSDQAKEENASFAFENPYGIEAIYIEYISSANKKELANWEKNKATYAKETAKGLIKFLDIKSGDNNDISD